MNRTLSIALVALSLTVGGAALAQEHGDNAGEHAAGGFHRPGPMRWVPGTPDTVTVNEGGREVTRPAPAPFIGPLVNFGILLVLGYMALTRSINPALAARREAVETEISTAKRMREEAEAMHREYAERAENLASELEALKAEFVRAGEAERDRIIADAKAQAERVREDGARSIEHEVAALRESLRREAVAAAAEAAEKAVRAAITPQDQARLADDFMNSLETEARA